MQHACHLGQMGQMPTESPQLSMFDVLCVYVKQQSSISRSSAREPVSCHQSIESII